MTSFGVGKGIAGDRLPPRIISDKIKMTILGKQGANESFELNAKFDSSATVLETDCGK